MSDIPTALQISFHIPESHANLPGLEWLEDFWCSQQDSSQYGIELLGPPEWGLERWPATGGIWWQGSLQLRLPTQDWPNVSGALDTVEKALWVVGETLEKLSTHVAIGTVGWVFFPAL